MMSATFFAAATMSFRCRPDSSTSREPSCTFTTLSWIRPLISRAAVALRWARLRTSAATTAKPRPCSPARAASTAAFSASRFVWNAISSITPMMSAMRWLDVLISAIADTARPATLPPRSAWSRASVASWLAMCALSALRFTVTVISSMLCAVSSRLAACSDERCVRRSMPELMSAAAVSTAPEVLRTS